MRILHLSNALSLALRVSAVLTIVSASLLSALISIYPALATGSNIWTVNVLTDSGLTTCAANAGSGGPACELRDAINEAAGRDTIIFSKSGQIVITATLPAITRTLTVDGTGKSVTISGNGSNYLIGQVSAGGNLSIKSLAIDGGVNDFGNGGAIDNSGTLNVTNSTFSGNSGYSQNGGAIFNSGTLTVTNSTFSGNSDGVGGAIYNSGTLTISNGLFSGNYGGVGGAIANTASGVATIATSTFSSNAAGPCYMYCDGNSGAIDNQGMLNITNSTFSNNLAGGSFGHQFSYGGLGGAIDNSGTLNIAGSTFSTNQTTDGNLSHSYGGAIDSWGTLNIANSTFSANSAYSSGAVVSTGTLNIVNSTFVGNSATANGTVTNAGMGINVLNNSLFSNDTGGDCVNVSGSTLNGAQNLSDGSCPGTLATATGVSATLGNNGGPTQTFALLSSSNAIDAVPNGACVYVSSGTNPLFTNGANITTDQRGVNRPRGASCDIGAVEFVSPSIDTIGVYRAGSFLLRLQNSTGNADLTVAFSAGTKPYPIVGDWTGAGFDTVGVFDRNSGKFTLCTANDSGSCANVANQKALQLGVPNDMPLAGRWLIGATNAGVGVFRPSNGLIYLKNALTTGYGDYAMILGIPGDVGLAGDWNGQLFDSPGVYRPSNSTFYLSNQVTNGSVTGDYQVHYGVGGDSPVAGDWIAQGHDGVGLFRQSNGFTYLKNQLATGYADNTFTYGIAGDVPIAGHWQVTYPPVAPASVLVAKTAVPSQQIGSAPDNNPLGD